MLAELVDLAPFHSLVAKYSRNKAVFPSSLRTWFFDQFRIRILLFKAGKDESNQKFFGIYPEKMDEILAAMREKNTTHPMGKNTDGIIISLPEAMLNYDYKPDIFFPVHMVLMVSNNKKYRQPDPEQQQRQSEPEPEAEYKAPPPPPEPEEKQEKESPPPPPPEPEIIDQKLTVFANGPFKLRAAKWDGNTPWFLKKDICKCLDLHDKTAFPDLEEKYKGVVDCLTPGGLQEFAIISEPGLYEIAFSNRKNPAFKKWVIEEVVPSIRKTGRYENPAETQNSLNAQIQLETLKVLRDIKQGTVKTEQAVQEHDGRIDQAEKDHDVSTLTLPAMQKIESYMIGVAFSLGSWRYKHNIQSQIKKLFVGLNRNNCTWRDAPNQDVDEIIDFIERYPNFNQLHEDGDKWALRNWKDYWEKNKSGRMSKDNEKLWKNFLKRFPGCKEWAINDSDPDGEDS